MTKQEFLNGKEFTLKGKNSNVFYKYERGLISELYYYKGRVIADSYECNVDKIGTKYFTFFTFCLNKKVSGKINFSEL